MRWDKKYPEKAAVTDYKYQNSERGFIITFISHLFTPCRIKRKNRTTNWYPQMTKSEIWEELLIHIQHMKDKFPNSTGRLCRYCEEPWTYLTRKTQRYPVKRNTRRTQHPTNFTIDRFDPTLTYTRTNIRFCCSECNDRKHDSTLEDWKNFLRVANE